MPRNRKLSDEAPVVGGGQKSPTDKPEPLVGEDRETKAPVRRVKRVQAEVRDDAHGAPAVVDLAVDRAVEADEAAPKDQPESAEAADQGNVVRPVDVERAELDAASHAERLAALESEVGPEALALGITAAGDRQGDHVRAVTVAARAAKAAIDSGDGHVARGRAFTAVEELGEVDSPHGRTAEEHDAWTAARWAPHGDQNVPAVSYGPEDSGALYGEANPAAADLARGLEGDSENEVERAKREAGPGVSIARERYLENLEAARVARESR